MTSPYVFYQFFLNAEDAKVIDYLKVFSPRGAEEIAELQEATRQTPHLRLAQRALADDVTDLVHGKQERVAAAEAGQALFGRGELSALPSATLEAALREAGAVEVNGPELPSLVDALALSGVVASKSAARRAIEEGGAYVNNAKVSQIDRRLNPDDLIHGRFVVLRRGRKTVSGLLLA